jgi:site-specific recombinase XerD
MGKVVLEFIKLYQTTQVLKEAKMIYPIISKAVEGFLLNKAASGRSNNTIRNYTKELSRFAEWLNDDYINKVTTKRIEEYMKYLREEFLITHVATTEIEPRRLSPKTFRNTWGTLSSFWNWTSKEYEISNPFNSSFADLTICP